MSDADFAIFMQQEEAEMRRVFTPKQSAVAVRKAIKQGA